MYFFLDSQLLLGYDILFVLDSLLFLYPLPTIIWVLDAMTPSGLLVVGEGGVSGQVSVYNNVLQFASTMTPSGKFWTQLKATCQN